jgi:hypothetical protein
MVFQDGLAVVGSFFLITDDNHENYALADFLVCFEIIIENLITVLKNEVHHVEEHGSEHFMANIFPLNIFLPQKDLRSQFFRLITTKIIWI